MTSVAEEQGPPERLLAWNRGDWAVENWSHRSRDVTFGEDACMARKANAPVNGAIRSSIALAVILSRGWRVASATRHFAPSRRETFDAVLPPC